MTAERLVTLLFAVCCLFAVVSMAVSLETTISGTPDEVVDIDTQSLPLSDADTDQLVDAVSDPRDRQAEVAVVAGEGSAEGGGDGDAGEPVEQRRQRPASDGQDVSQGPAGGAGGASDSAAGQAVREASQAASEAAEAAGGSDESASTAASRGWLGRLLALFGLALALACLAVAYRKRKTILDRLRALLGLNERSGGVDTGPTDASRPPANEVERRWLETVSRADDDPAATPRERARAAVEAGLPATPVRELTALYERVRYGDEPVTDQAVAEASSYARQSAGESDD